MTLSLVQDAVVTGIALLAAVLIARRLVGFLVPKAGGGCASCASGRPCASTPKPDAVANSTPIPIELLRSPKRS